jgi:uncharacterized membrane protein
VVDARLLHRLLLLSILAGIAFSVYAAAEVLDPALQGSCSISAFFSCGAVDQSGHTTLGSIPDWSIGLGGFVLLLALDLPLLSTFDPRLLNAVLLFSGVGVAVSLYLGYVELDIIHALCPICLGAYLSNAVAFLLALTLVGIRRIARSEAD